MRNRACMGIPRQNHASFMRFGSVTPGLLYDFILNWQNQYCSVINHPADRTFSRLMGDFASRMIWRGVGFLSKERNKARSPIVKEQMLRN